MDVPEGRIRADHLDIELDQAPPASREPQQLILDNMLTLTQMIQLWLIVGLLLGSLIILPLLHLLPLLHHIYTNFPPQIQPANVRRGSK